MARPRTPPSRVRVACTRSASATASWSASSTRAADGRASATCRLRLDQGPRAARPVAAIAQLLEEHTAAGSTSSSPRTGTRTTSAGFGLDARHGVIDALKPGLVLRPWTEDPDSRPTPRARVRSDSRAACRRPRGAQHAGLARLAACGPSRAARRGAVASLAARDQLTNHEAVANLDERWAKADGVYLAAGATRGSSELVPGIGVECSGRRRSSSGRGGSAAGRPRVLAPPSAAGVD